jgi:hypothetical protein
MLIGKLLLAQCNITLAQLTHKNFEEIRAYFDSNKDTLFDQANTLLTNALTALYNSDYRTLDVLRLSAAFRRGDLLSRLQTRGAI